MKKPGKTILVIGNCGVGKTWVMKQLISEYKLSTIAQCGKIKMRAKGTTAVLGKYIGDTYDGSDKLSMSVATDFINLKYAQKEFGLDVVCEGDRFMNQTFVNVLQPYVIKIEGNGEQGRQERGSNQSERHLKAIRTRVGNMATDKVVKDSATALEHIKTIINGKS